MATSSVEDLSRIVLLLGSFSGIHNILNLSDNTRYESKIPRGDDKRSADWSGNQSQTPTAPFLALMFGEHMYTPQGWIFGSSDDSDKCDIQLAKDNTTGISRQHFRIDVSPSMHCPRLTVLSGNPVQVHIDERTVSLNKGQAMEIISAVFIDLGEVRMRAWRPTLTPQEEISYRQNVEKFSKEVLDALPMLAINAKSPKVSTFSLRFGKNNAVYRREDTGTIGTGSFASVMKVKELYSGDVFAAKVPHFKASDSASRALERWESVTEEFNKIVQLRHSHIVQAIEVLTGSRGIDPPWLIMENIKYDLGSTNLDAQDVPTLLTHVSEGLAFMHAHGFTHRDLKPENVLLQLERRRLVIAKISDFGTTKYDLSGKMQTYTGASVYMAPEFWEQELAYTKAIDMWSFGVIAVEHLADLGTRLDGWDAKFPPTKSQHQEWVVRVLQRRVADAPEEFKPLLQGLLSEKLEDRWTATDCKQWLLKNASADIGSSRKRRASSRYE